MARPVNKYQVPIGSPHSWVDNESTRKAKVQAAAFEEGVDAGLKAKDGEWRERIGVFVELHQHDQVAGDGDPAIHVWRILDELLKG
jgi:hypothetical protein